MSELSVKEERFLRRRCLWAIYVDSTKPRAEDAAAVVTNERDFEEGTEGIVLSCAGRLSGAGDRASDFSDTLAEMDGEANGWRPGGSSRITMLRRWRWERRFDQHYQG